MTTVTSIAPKSTRDHRVDFWRGIALAMIFVNHIPGNFWENFTSRNFGFSDAAELFVFLAGFASAYAYAPLFMAGERLVATLKAWRRAGVLYLVHITLTVAAIAIFSWAALTLGYGDMMRTIGLQSFITMPLETMIGVAGLGHQLGYVNILPMYCVLLLMLPLHIALAQISRGVMLAGAVLMWVVAYVWAIDVPAFPLPGGWFFNPFSWQLIFAVGLYCGLTRRQNGVAAPYRPWLYALALAYALLAFLTIRFGLWWIWGQSPLPVLITGFDKTYVSLTRLLHVMAICYLFANAAATSPFANISRDNIFAMLGRHSLPVFAVGTVLSLFGQVIKHGDEPSIWFDTPMILVGLTILFALARYLDWWRKAAKVTVGGTGPVAAGARGAIATPDAAPPPILKVRRPA
ncbi:OpgC domain-containing protein [Aurantimonas sp. A2-1-M11]|uniref:OpgC family protein n=1 Tax=Aurantimonas sp. A2-1-M11 TaxID=3113712 RepID=UPI002F94AF36